MKRIFGLCALGVLLASEISAQSMPTELGIQFDVLRSRESD